MNRAKTSHAPSWLPKVLLPAAIGTLVLWVTFDRGEALAFLDRHKDALLHFSSAHSMEAWVGWGLLYWAVATAGLPVAIFFSLMSGFMFGPFGGMMLDLVFASLGATTALLLFRYVYFDWVREKIGSHPRLALLLEGARSNGFLAVLFMRLVPVFPFWLVNLSLSVTGIRPVVFWVATAVGMIPASALITRLGYSLRAHWVSGPYLTGQQEILLGLLGILSLLPAIARKFRPIGRPE